MEKINFNLSICQKEEPKMLALSKFFGNPVFPKDFVEKNIDDYDYFLCQINLNQLNKEGKYPLPNGMLYFFLNVRYYPYKAKVLYTDKMLEQDYSNFNDSFEDLKCKQIFYLNFAKNEESNFLFGNIDADEISEIDTTDYVNLLCIDSLTVPNSFPNFGAIDGFYYFLIKQSDLLKFNFKKVLFVAHSS